MRRAPPPPSWGRVPAGSSPYGFRSLVAVVLYILGCCCKKKKKGPETGFGDGMWVSCTSEKFYCLRQIHLVENFTPNNAPLSGPRVVAYPSRHMG